MCNKKLYNEQVYFDEMEYDIFKDLVCYDSEKEKRAKEWMGLFRKITGEILKNKYNKQLN
ncbi:MAG: hypothetical protein ACOCQD_02520 [archaeon]